MGAQDPALFSHALHKFLLAELWGWQQPLGERAGTVLQGTPGDHGAHVGAVCDEVGLPCLGYQAGSYLQVQDGGVAQVGDAKPMRLGYPRGVFAGLSRAAAAG